MRRTKNESYIGKYLINLRECLELAIEKFKKRLEDDDINALYDAIGKLYELKKKNEETEHDD